MYAEAVLNKHLPSEQSAMLTPAFSSSAPAVLPKKLVSGWVLPAAVSATVVRYLYLQLCLCQDRFNSLFIPAAACLPARLVPPAGMAALQLCQGALKLPVPRHCPGTAVPGSLYHPPKGFWCGWLPRAVVVSRGKQEALQWVSTRQNWAEDCSLSKQPGVISAVGSCSQQQLRCNGEWYPHPWLLTSYDFRC